MSDTKIPSRKKHPIEPDVLVGYWITIITKLSKGSLRKGCTIM